MKFDLDGTTWTVHFNYPDTDLDNITACRIHEGDCTRRQILGTSVQRCVTPALDAETMVQPQRRREPFFDRHGTLRVRIREVLPSDDPRIGRRAALGKVLGKMYPRVDLNAVSEDLENDGVSKEEMREKIVEVVRLNKDHRAQRQRFWTAYWAWVAPRDRCELCGGKRRGTRGQENLIVVEGRPIIACNPCATDRGWQIPGTRKLLAVSARRERRIGAA